VNDFSVIKDFLGNFRPIGVVASLIISKTQAEVSSNAAFFYVLDFLTERLARFGFLFRKHWLSADFMPVTFLCPSGTAKCTSPAIRYFF